MDRINRLKNLVSACRASSRSSVHNVSFIEYKLNEDDTIRYALVYEDPVNLKKYLTTGLHLKMTNTEYLFVRSYIQDFMLIGVPPENGEEIDWCNTINLTDAIHELPWEHVQPGIDN